jgi:hypothetical protein
MTVAGIATSPLSELEHRVQLRRAVIKVRLSEREPLLWGKGQVAWAVMLRISTRRSEAARAMGSRSGRRIRQTGVKRRACWTSIGVTRPISDRNLTAVTSGGNGPRTAGIVQRS